MVMGLVLILAVFVWIDFNFVLSFWDNKESMSINQSQDGSTKFFCPDSIYETADKASVLPDTKKTRAKYSNKDVVAGVVFALNNEYKLATLNKVFDLNNFDKTTEQGESDTTELYVPSIVIGKQKLNSFEVEAIELDPAKTVIGRIVKKNICGGKQENEVLVFVASSDGNDLNFIIDDEYSILDDKSKKLDGVQVGLSGYYYNATIADKIRPSRNECERGSYLVIPLCVDEKPVPPI